MGGEWVYVGVLECKCVCGGGGLVGVWVVRVGVCGMEWVCGG